MSKKLLSTVLVALFIHLLS